MNILEKEDHIWLLINTKKDKKDFLHQDVVKILNHYAKDDLDFAFSENGKPYIKNNLDKPIYFSISNSHDLLALSVSLNDLGLDIELDKKRKFIDRIKKRYFSLNEDNFYKSFTAREAFIKATGERFFNIFSHINLIKINHEYLIGIKQELSHRVDFFHYKNFIIALARERSKNKTVKIFSY